MNRELWTATSEDDNEAILFNVTDLDSGEFLRTEQRHKAGLPLMFMLGGYPGQLGIILTMLPYPWSFKKIGDNIYVETPAAA